MTHTHQRHSIVLLLFSALAFCVGASDGGCGSGGDGPDLTEGGGDAVESSDETAEEMTAEASLLSAFTEADPDAASDEEELAAAAESGAAAEFDSSCITSAIDKNVVTYQLDGCTGRFGFVTVSGEIEATYTLNNEGAVTAVLSGPELTVNDGTASLNATVVRTIEGDERTLDVSSHWTGETEDGKMTARNGDYVSVVDFANECLGLDGTWDSSIGSTAWTTTVADYRICKGSCPESGGTIEWDGARNTTTVTFDGTNEASWSNTREKSGTITLGCGG